MKKLLCFALSLMMILSVAVVPTVAETTELKIPEGAVKMSDLVKPDIKIEDIKSLLQIYQKEVYQANTAFYIASADDLRIFSAVSNAPAADGTYYSGDDFDMSFTDKTVYLATNIDMSGVTDFKPISYHADCSNSGRPRFRGTFDGQGFSIKNLKMESSEGNVGLFGLVHAGATIKNLTIDSTCSFTYTGGSSAVSAGSLAAYVCVESSPTVTDSEVTVTTGVSISAVIKNVQSYANVTSTQYAGGLIGQVSHFNGNNTIVIQNCIYGGTVSGGMGAAGIATARIIGSIAAVRYIDINSCVVSGSVISNGDAAGILINEYKDIVNAKITSIKDCTISGTIKGANPNPLAIATLLNTNLKISGCDVSNAKLETVGEIGYTYKDVEKKDLTEVDSIQTLTPTNTEREYKIETPADLVFFSNYVNGLGTATDAKAFMYGYTVYLANNLDMTGVPMSAIGSRYAGTPTEWPKNDVQYFAGTFDGQGYTIDNLAITSDITAGDVYLGLFGALRGATVKNVVLGSRCSFTYSGSLKSYVGSIAGMAHSLQPNNAFKDAYPNELKWDNDADGSLNAYCSNVDCPTTTISNCYSAATVSSKNYAGGIVGLVEVVNNSQPGTLIAQCTNVGAVSSNDYAAGILGTVDRSVNVVNCRNAGKISGATYAGGIAGYYGAKNDTTDNSYRYAVISNCANNGELAGTGTTAGIVANKLYDTTAVTNCTDHAASGNQLDTDWTSVKFVGVQTMDTGDTYSVRFLATVNDLSVVTTAGFQIEITYGGSTKTVNPLYASYAYDSVYFQVDENTKDTAYAGAYSGVYFISAVLTDVPDGANVTFNVKTIENGVTAVEGESVTLNSGAEVA